MNIEFNEQYQYMIIDLDYIQDNIDEITNETILIHSKIKSLLHMEENNITWEYCRFNFFTMVGGSQHYYNIYKVIKDNIIGYFDRIKFKPDQMWFQSWINVHLYDEVLKAHDHTLEYHGYFSIDPKDSDTIFIDENNNELYRVKNKIGRIYIGPTRRRHYVQNNAPYDDHRVTIAFDISVKAQPPITGNIMFPIY